MRLFQQMQELALMGQDTSGMYKSRGHGRGTLGKVYRSRGKDYPFSSKRQDERTARKCFMKLMPNGHEVMQMRSTFDIERMKNEVPQSD
jgi:hypothetical protein